MNDTLALCCEFVFLFAVVLFAVVSYLYRGVEQSGSSSGS